MQTDAVNQNVQQSYNYNNPFLYQLVKFNNYFVSYPSDLSFREHLLEVVKKILLVVPAVLINLGLGLAAAVVFPIYGWETVEKNPEYGNKNIPNQNNNDNNDNNEINGATNQSDSGSTASKTVTLPSVNGDLGDLSSFVHEIAINDEEKAKFNQIKYLYSKSSHGITRNNCFLKFQFLENKNKIWSLIDVENGNSFSVLMNTGGKLFAQTDEYQNFLEILISHLE